MSQHYFIHLGLHKTATTSTQKFLDDNSDVLLSNDVRYIPLLKMRNEITPLFCSLNEHKRKMLFELLESFPNKKIILSDENILGGTVDIKEGILYKFSKNRVVSFCEEAGKRPVTLFLTLRDPSSFVTSMYCEHLRHSAYITFDDYVKAMDLENFSYAQIFGWLKKLPKNSRAIVVPFEAPPEHRMLATASRILKETIGVHAMSGLGEFPDKRYRSSYSQEELDLASTIAKQAGGKMHSEFLNRLDANNCRFGTTKFSPLDPGLVQRMNERYQDELAGFFSPYRA